MNERVKFVAAMLAADETFLELCERFGISRKQGYKWKECYERGGVEALVDRSRAPHSHPHAVTSEVVQLMVTARKKHPTWGPQKLLVVVKRHHPRLVLPAASTVGQILKKQGLIGRRRRVRRSEPYGERLGPYDAANRVWCADFKGHFAVGEGRCNPLTISDGFSRYGPVLIGVLDANKTRALNNHRRFGVLVRADGHLRKKRRRRRPYRR